MTRLAESDREMVRRLLLALQEHVQTHVLAQEGAAQLADVAEVTVADTIYRIDKVSEAAVIDWFDRHWPAAWPVRIVMEGIEGDGPIVPQRAKAQDAPWMCLLDPIDGTRGIMYAKRAAWTLAAFAERPAGEARLSDVTVAAMTELPTVKQWRADRVSGWRDGPLHAESADVRTGRDSVSLTLRPSQARSLDHGFAGFARFFGEGKAACAALEAAVLKRAFGAGVGPVFDDQYICSGGQLFELMGGRDRMLGDLRALMLPALGFESALCCHPYDICTVSLAQTAGCVIEAPDGGPLDAPLDTTTGVAWVGYANTALADVIRPALHQVLSDPTATWRHNAARRPE